MSNVSYDLDTSGGLMPLIRALIKPPDEDANVQKPKKPQHPYYKRPGKGHNHDSCDACGEGGDLICCDRCPASFHLGCYDPPLDENDIPAGLWLCRECRASDAEKPSSARGSRAQSPVDITEKKTRSLRNNRSNSTKKKSKDEDEEEKEPEEMTPMETLVKAARIMNPRQFELPREMKVPCLFPGTEKEGSKNGNSGLVSVDAWGCVPLPAKACFVCHGTCRAAPLLQCDYCPLLYHQDCLDPPLTALPTGRWMCPNHVEQYIDWKLVNSVSATERVALWDKFSGPVDQHAIKIDFIRRARAHNPAFRIKVPVGMRGRVVVPPMVRHHYRRPPPLLPSRREMVRCRRVLKQLKEDPDYDSADEEDSSAPKHQICLNLSCPQYTGEGRCPYAEDHGSLEPATEGDAESDLKAISEEPEEEERDTESSSDMSESEEEGAGGARRRQGGARGPPRAALVRLGGGREVRRLLRRAGRQLRRLDGRLVRLLAWQRLHQVAWGEQARGAWARAGLSARAQRAVARAVAAARLAARGAALPSALLSPADRRRIAALVWGPPPPDPGPAPAPARAGPAAPRADDYVRATLSPVHAYHRLGLTPGAGAGAVAMRRAVLAVGTDTECALRLPPVCRHAAPRHATIFLDEVTGHFELINYAEWGTVVNGVLYACDVRAPAARTAPAARPLTITGSLTRGPEEWEGTEGAEGRCRCAARAPAEGAWEGSALLPHGALVAFGCLHYVFSIADCLH